MKLAALLAPLALAACAPMGQPAGSALGPPLPPPPPSGAALSGADCFRSNDIRNHTIGNSQTLYLRVNRGDVYRVSMRGSCLAGAINSDPLVMRSPPGSTIVCKPIDLDVGVSKSGTAAVPCLVDSIVKMTPAETDALPRKLKP